MEKTYELSIKTKDDHSLSLAAKNGGMSKIEIIGALNYHIQYLIQEEDGEQRKKGGE